MVDHRAPAETHPRPAEFINPAPSLLSRISWGAIFAGAAIAVGLTILFGLLGTAIGFRAIDPQSTSPFAGLGVGIAIWWILTSVISLAIGGYVAGHVSGQPDRPSAISHGAATWGVVTIVTLWMAVGAIGTAVNTATGAVTTIARTSVDVIGAVGGAVLPDDVNLSPELRQAREQIRQEAEQILAEADIGEQELSRAQEEIGAAAAEVARRPGELDEQVSALIDELFRGEDAVFSDSERQQLIEALAARAGMTPEEAQAVVQRWEEQARNAATSVETVVSEVRSTAGETGEDALDALSSASWYAFFASLLSLVAAIAAAAFGAPRHAFLSRRET